MGENHFSSVPVAVYGVVLLGSGCAYTILTRVLLASHPEDSLLAQAVGTDTKGRVSLAIYATAIAVALAYPWLAGILYAAVAIIWLIPDRRIEKVLSN